jgi:hypothetical protein
LIAIQYRLLLPTHDGGYTIATPCSRLP